MNEKFRLILSVLLLLPGMIVLAQEEELDSLLRKQVIVENPVYKPVIGFGAGILNFYGDVRNDFINPMIGNYAFRVNVSTFIDKKKRSFAGNFFLFTGALTGNERSYKDPVRNLNFRSEIVSFGINGEYNFKHLLRNENAVIRPFISTGVEVITFNSKGDLFDAGGRKYYYWADGTIRNIDEIYKNTLPNAILNRDWNFETDLREQNLYDLGNYSRTTFGIPVDAGVDFRVNYRVKMRLGVSGHFTFTDNIDNVSWQGTGVTGNERNDHFSFIYLTMHLDLFSDPTVRVEELKFAELGDFDYTMFEDEDRDGVIDASDDCPHTPAGVEVDTLGCPYDTDNDGVPDYIDREENTARGAFVDDYGVTMTEDEVIARLSFTEAVDRKDLPLYYTVLEAGRRMTLSELPAKFLSLDTDKDDYLSFDELLKAIDDFFDYRSELNTDEVYRIINFFFAQ